MVGPLRCVRLRPLGSGVIGHVCRHVEGVDELCETAPAPPVGCLASQRPWNCGAVSTNSGSPNMSAGRPRPAPPRMPGGELTLEPPPEPERIVPAGVLQRMLPLVMLVGSVGFIAVLGVNQPTSWLFGGMFAISSLGMLLTGTGRGGGSRAAGIDEDRRDYLRYLSVLRGRVRGIAAEQRAALEWSHPEPSAWPAV